MTRDVVPKTPWMRVLVAGARTPLATAEVADTAAARMRGLLGRDGLERGSGLILEPCRSIHTFTMRFAIDVVFYDRQHRVTRAFRNLPPSRLVWGGWRARAVLELPAGTLGPTTVQPGSRLQLEPVADR